eukprot:83303_1
MAELSETRKLISVIQTKTKLKRRNEEEIESITFKDWNKWMIKKGFNLTEDGISKLQKNGFETIKDLQQSTLDEMLLISTNIGLTEMDRVKLQSSMEIMKNHKKFQNEINDPSTQIGSNDNIITLYQTKHQKEHEQIPKWTNIEPVINSIYTNPENKYLLIAKLSLLLVALKYTLNEIHNISKISYHEKRKKWLPLLGLIIIIIAFILCVIFAILYNDKLFLIIYAGFHFFGQCVVCWWLNEYNKNTAKRNAIDSVRNHLENVNMRYGQFGIIWYFYEDKQFELKSGKLNTYYHIIISIQQDINNESIQFFADWLKRQ